MNTFWKLEEENQTTWYEKDAGGNCIGTLVETPAYGILIMEYPEFNNSATETTQAAYLGVYERGDGFGSRPPLH